MSTTNAYSLTRMSVVMLLLMVSMTDAETLKFRPEKQKHTSSHLALDPEVNMTATQLITSKGFPCESHWVTTEDGYILRMFRIPHGRKASNSKGPKPVVILQHGLLGSAIDYLTNPVNESLSYILADAGADVWLSNSRGTVYSINHTTLDPDQKEFWQFSWDEMGKYDLPAVVDYVLNSTKVKKVFYVGHSQGTTLAFAGLSENAELNTKIDHFLAMAPVARVWHLKSPIKKLAPLAKDIDEFISLFGDGSFATSQAFNKWLAGHLCDSWGSICADILFVVCGFDSKSFNMTRMPVIAAHTPGGTSVMNMLKWAQGINSHKFQKFDYGSAAENMKHYNQTTPPIYNLRNVKVPVAVFAGGADWLSVPEDIEWLLPQINVSYFEDVTHYAHLDFIWAFDSPRYIYDKFMPIIFKTK